MLSLTQEQVEVLKSIDGGADIFAHGAATLLRGLERTHPGLLRIVEAQGKYCAIGPTPYFGAILTAAGRRACRRARATARR